jgi:hypothetical protein
MRKEDLREATRKAAEKRTHKLTTRLSKGEKRNAKRMAEVAAVYTIERHHRTPEDIIGDTKPVHEVAPARPRPEYKRVWASLKKDAGEVIDDSFQHVLEYLWKAGHQLLGEGQEAEVWVKERAHLALVPRCRREKEPHPYLLAPLVRRLDAKHAPGCAVREIRG